MENAEDWAQLNARTAELDQRNTDLVCQLDRLREKHVVELSQLREALRAQYEAQVNEQRQDFDTFRETTLTSKQDLNDELDLRGRRIEQLQDELVQQEKRYEEQQSSLAIRINEAVEASEERFQASAQLEHKQLLEAFDREKVAILEEKREIEDEWRLRESELAEQNEQLAAELSELRKRMDRFPNEPEGESAPISVDRVVELDREPPPPRVAPAEFNEPDSEISTMFFQPGEIDELLKKKAPPPEVPATDSEFINTDEHSPAARAVFTADDESSESEAVGFGELSSTRIIAPTFLEELSGAPESDAPLAGSDVNVMEPAPVFADPEQASVHVEHEDEHFAEESDFADFQADSLASEQDLISAVAPLVDEGAHEGDDEVREPETADDGEKAKEELDEIQAYMQRLLNRSVTATEDEDKVETGTTEPALAQRSQSANEPTREVKQRPVGPANDAHEEEFVPRSMAPELKADLKVLREVANQSAKQAISVSSRAQARNVFLSNLVIAFVVGSCGCIAWTFSDSVLSVTWLGGSAAVVVAAYLACKAFAQAGFILTEKVKASRQAP